MIDSIRTLLKYRALISNLVIRSLKARYRGSFLGFLWSFLNPLFLMVIYTAVFSLIMRAVNMENYAVFLFCGLLPWIWFSSSLIEGANSILHGAGLITKSMFPPEVLPTVFVISNLINFLLSLPILFMFIIYYKIPIGLPLLTLPLIITVQFLLTYGIAFIVAALNVPYRDVQHILGNIVTFWFFATPIIYPITMNMPNKMKVLLLFNPMTTLMLSYQDIFYYNRFPRWDYLGLLGILSLILVVIAFRLFNRYKESFAELI